MGYTMRASSYDVFSGGIGEGYSLGDSFGSESGAELGSSGEM